MRCRRYLVAVTVAVVVGAPTALAAPPPTPGGVEKLWSQFPLTTPARGKPAAVHPAPSGGKRPHVAKQPAAPATPARTEPTPSQHAQARNSGTDGRIVVAMGSTAVVVAVLALALLSRRGSLSRTSSNSEGGEMPDFLRPRGRKDGKEQGENTDAGGWVSTAVGSYSVRTADGGGGVTEPPAPVEKAPEEPEPVSESAGLDMSSVGEHVASVLAAAEGAAQRIRSEAQQEAKETEQEAARAANEIRTRATQEAQAERASSRRLVDEAEVASRGIRAEADQYADDRRREAEAQAAQTVRDAERRAASIADTSDERNRVLLANIAESETRLRDLAQSLRGVAASLDDVVGNADTAELGDQELAPERLEDALRIDVDDGRRDVKGRR